MIPLMTRKNFSRAAPPITLLLTALAGAGCGIDLTGLQGSPICTLDCGGERPPSGAIRSSPVLASLTVGETMRVTATLSGPIVHFSSMEWSTRDSSVVRVQALACTQPTGGDTRTCSAEVTGRGPGSATVWFKANLNPSFFDPLYGRTDLVVTSP